LEKFSNSDNTADPWLETVFQNENANSNEQDPDLNYDVNTNYNKQAKEVEVVNLNKELSNDIILSFLRENEIIENEMDLLKSHVKLNELEVFELILEIRLNKASN
jgi:hypothetical protein